MQINRYVELLCPGQKRLERPVVKVTTFRSAADERSFEAEFRDRPSNSSAEASGSVKGRCANPAYLVG